MTALNEGVLARPVRSDGTTRRSTFAWLIDGMGGRIEITAVAELAFSDEEELTGEIIARNLRELADRLHSDTRNEPSFHSSPSAEARAKVVELAKQFCDHEPLSPRKQAGHRVGLHRAVAKLREIERHV